MLRGLPRALHHPPARLDPQVVDRLLEIRDDPPVQRRLRGSPFLICPLFLMFLTWSTLMPFWPSEGTAPAAVGHLPGICESRFVPLLHLQQAGFPAGDLIDPGETEGLGLGDLEWPHKWVILRMTPTALLSYHSCQKHEGARAASRGSGFLSGMAPAQTPEIAVRAAHCLGCSLERAGSSRAKAGRSPDVASSPAGRASFAEECTQSIPPGVAT